MTLVEYIERLIKRRLTDDEKQYMEAIKNVKPTETFVQTPRGYYIVNHKHSQK